MPKGNSDESTGSISKEPIVRHSETRQFPEGVEGMNGQEDLKNSARENKKFRFGRKSEVAGNEVAGYGFGV